MFSTKDDFFENSFSPKIAPDGTNLDPAIKNSYKV